MRGGLHNGFIYAIEMKALALRNSGTKKAKAVYPGEELTHE